MNFFQKKRLNYEMPDHYDDDLEELDEDFQSKPPENSKKHQANY